MVIGAFPVIQLLYTGIRQISRPLSNRMREKAITNRFFREYVCIPLAQFYNIADVRMKFRLLDLKKPSHIRPLTPTQAIDLGAELFTEIMVFGISALTILIEYARQVYNANKKKGEEDLNIADMTSKIIILSKIMDDHSKQLAIIKSEVDSLKK